jgi:hypothetical protein
VKVFPEVIYCTRGPKNSTYKNFKIENDHRLNQVINIFNLTNCIREPTRLGALLDPILFSDELETTFSDVIQVDRTKSDHDATIAFFPIPYDLQANYLNHQL